MSSRSDPGGCDGALYMPPVSRALLEQLNEHLRGFCEADGLVGLHLPDVHLPDARLSDARLPDVHLPDGEGASAHGLAPSPEDLAGSLSLISRAAVLMGRIDLLFRSPDAGTDADPDADLHADLDGGSDAEPADGIGRLTRRISDYERSLEAMVDRLRSAQHDIEQYRQRSLAAEQKLEFLMDAISQSLSNVPVRSAASPPCCSAAS